MFLQTDQHVGIVIVSLVSMLMLAFISKHFYTTLCYLLLNTDKKSYVNASHSVRISMMVEKKPNII